jgi:outer membrane immunogenic protein
MAAPAAAADLGVRYKAPPAAVVAAPSWSGFYLGVQGGYSWVDSDTGYDNPEFAALLAERDGSLSSSPKGGFGGVHAGYNIQSGNVVFGLYGDISFGRVRSDITDVLGMIDGSTGDHLETNSDWFGTVRGRLGYLANPALLLYATGGFAFTHVKVRSVDYDPQGPVSILNTSANLNGWTVGAGLEYKVAPSWSVRAEYLYTDLGDHTYFSGADWQSTSSATTSTVQVSLSYHIGGL